MILFTELNGWTILLAAMITALATGLGAIPFFFVKDMGRWWLSLANAMAAGLMLGASHSLINEGLAYGLLRLSAGIILGILFMVVAHHFLEQHEDLHIGELQGANAIKAFLIIGAMTVHSFSEGVGVGVSFGGGEALGNLITIAIAIHNIPEGLAISLVMVPRGTPAWQASLWSIFSSLPQPFMAVPAFLFVTIFEPFLPVGLGFAAGAMMWMVFAELIPEAFDEASSNAVAITVSLSIVVMLIFQTLLKA